MGRTVHKIFPGNETIIPGRSPIFPGSDTIILGQFPLKIASKPTQIEKLEQKNIFLLLPGGWWSYFISAFDCMPCQAITSIAGFLELDADVVSKDLSAPV